MITLDNLNKEQKEAVLHIDGPCLVMAGAGSGKTRVLTTRIANLIDNGISPANILAITFTNKAAKEMKERVNLILPNNNVQIGTFHSLGLKIIRENLKALDFSTTISIIDSDDVMTLIKKIMKDKDIDSKIYSPYYIRNRISFIKNEMLDDAEISKFLTTPPEKIAISIYREYQKILHNNNSVDFDDLLVLPVKLFLHNKDILEKYQERYRYILIDEYQDTNEVQYKFSKLLAAKYKNIFVVGDSDQSIYSFRNANYKNILNFEKDYKNTKIILLEENYRSTKNILNVANSIIKNNKERKEKKLKSNNAEGLKVKYLRSYDEKHEVKLILDEVKKLNEEGIELKDIAILYRTNAQVRVVEELMLQKNIPYRVVGSFYFYGRKEIKDLICYLRLILNKDDDISLRRVINVPKRGIGNVSIAKLEKLAEEKESSMFSALSSDKELEFKEIILDLINDSDNVSLTELIDLVIEKSGIKNEYESNKNLENELRIENIMEFKSIAASFENRTGSVNLSDFLEEITLISDMTLAKEDTNGINLMTLHSSKGLEFKAVFLIGMEENIFPHSNSIMEGNLEEERRLCYVGVTRAEKILYLTNAKRRMLYGRDTINAPSRFIDEINPDLLDIINSRMVEPKKIKKEDYYTTEDVEYKKGDILNHDLYGTGVVIDIEKNLLTIAFSKEFGVKKMLKNYKGMRKI